MVRITVSGSQLSLEGRSQKYIGSPIDKVRGLVLLLLLVGADMLCEIRTDQIETGARSTSKEEFGWGSTGGGVRRDPVVEEELGKSVFQGAVG